MQEVHSPELPRAAGSNVTSRVTRFLGACHVCSYICQMTCIKSSILQIMAAI